MLASPCRASARRRPGYVVAVVAILLVFLTGMVAFAIDIGYIAQTRTSLQSAADSAAHAGAYQFVYNPGQSAASVSATTTILKAAAKAEITKYAGLNGNLGVLDADITYGIFDPTKAVGSRWKTTLAITDKPNGVQVTIRRDATANGSLPMFFAPVMGVQSTNVLATGTAFIDQAYSLGSGSELIPFAVPENYYRKAVGQQLLTKNDAPYVDQPLVEADPTASSGVTVTQDAMKPGSNNTVANFGDGVNEMLLYSSDQTTSGNYGSIDLGSQSNGTPDLERQLLYGPTTNDLNILDSYMEGKATSTGNTAYKSVVVNGEISIPGAMASSGATFTGDPGISSGMKDAFQSIVGQTRVIPLYTGEVGKQGNNAEYNVTRFVSVVVMKADFQGNPKQVWVQPTGRVSSRATGSSSAQPGSVPIAGVYAPPRIVIP